ncbi:hypothetical protein FB157_1537 [Streptomyces sp. BK340]|nr:hypothetical protein FB157_1537 [Streptomyces sp. BK340]
MTRTPSASYSSDPLRCGMSRPVRWYPPSAMACAPRQTRSTPDSVNARQSLRLPGSGRPIATTRRLSASITTCRFVEYQ